MSAALEVRDLTKAYRKADGSALVAVDHIGFAVERGESFGIVGESGSGKSTAARLITRLERADAGRILVDGADIAPLRGRALHPVYRKLQMVFQNPVDSFNPRIRVGHAIVDCAVNFGMSRAGARQALPALLARVGLEPALAGRYPHQLSGGECQRAAIARALAAGPEILIFDEATSALDVSVQAQILALLGQLRERQGLTCIFISHDLALVRAVCEHVAVLYRGKIVETGRTEAVTQRPAHPYTRLLLSSALPLDPDIAWQPPAAELSAAIPGAAGCVFRHRCADSADRCETAPPLRQVSPEQAAACWLAEN